MCRYVKEKNVNKRKLNNLTDIDPHLLKNDMKIDQKIGQKLL